MQDINIVLLNGRVTHDVGEKDFSYLSTGSAKLKISIAVNDTKKNGDTYEDEASFFDVEYIGKAAEGIKPYITKGTMISVKGKLKQDRWEKDGKKNSRIFIKAEFIQLMGGKKGNGETTFTPIQNAMPQQEAIQETIPF